MDTFAEVLYADDMGEYDDEIVAVQWDHAPDSELRPRISPNMGRPRDKRFDAIIEKSVAEGPQRAEVPSRLVQEITRGLKRGARYLGTGIQIVDYYPENDESGECSVIEFVAWRKPEGE